ncbi:hypothetical protein WMY93_012685 [Mugilogobius chulae]|uniref:L1 transposable element RRM domain-containing protein n=1 Tax=Mugilogobius chulae TaxID=88201 RepID=A0AAW0P9B9_9GOBI
MPKNPKKKSLKTTERCEEEDEVLSQASSASNMDDNELREAKGKDGDGEGKFDQILNELRDFRKENKEQLSAMRKDISGISKRMDEAEERIITAENHIQSAEDLLMELAKRQSQVEEKLVDLEGRSRRDNVRIYGVVEGAEDNASSVINFIETLLGNGLGLSSTVALALRERTELWEGNRRVGPHRGPFWEKIYLDNDYAPEVQRKRREYTSAKAALREKNIRFQTPFPAKLRVHYSGGTVIYNSAQEATEDMVKRGISVNIVKTPASLLEQMREGMWQTKGKRANKDDGDTAQMPSFKEKLQAFRRQEDTE